MLIRSFKIFKSFLALKNNLIFEDGEENGAPGGGFNQAEDNSQVILHSFLSHTDIFTFTFLHSVMMIIFTFTINTDSAAPADLCDEQLLWSWPGRRPLLGLPQRQGGEAREVQLPSP